MGWTLTVEDFGRIERAEVEVRPLTVFVGDNSTGKSYLASLIWGIVAMQGELRLDASPRYEECLTWLRSRVSTVTAAPGEEIPPSQVRAFTEVFEGAFAATARDLVQRVFNGPTSIGKASLKTVPPGYAKLEWRNEEPSLHHAALTTPEGTFGFSYVGADERVHGIAARLIANRIGLGRLARDLLRFTDTFQSPDPIFMPASRTGFMLLYKSAMRASMQRELRGAAAPGALSELTTPAFHFLDLLVSGVKSDPAGVGPSFAAEADLLEQAIGGDIEVVSSNIGVPDYRFKMAGDAGSLSMSRSSSLVTEVAPILLVLRHLTQFPLLVLEEPEAHLHPRLQRVLARVIARLVNKGVHVLITTHSTTFCQQLNNLIKLGSMPAGQAADARKKWGYAENEGLRLEDVGGYQLVPSEENGRTQVTELRKTERGLVMPSFNRELVRLGQEMDDLDGRFEEDGP